jgi:hypothetical protein
MPIFPFPVPNFMASDKQKSNMKPLINMMRGFLYIISKGGYADE